jgi:hypothetical protein
MRSVALLLDRESMLVEIVEFRTFQDNLKMS